jgi:glycerophosphoryl diester phosphodiesterase
LSSAVEAEAPIFIAMWTIAHRGASGYAPENTAAAFELAITMRADMIETDARRTSDGQIVLFHDDTLDAKSDGHGPLGQHELEQLSLLDFGAWFDPRFAGERILTLTEYLDRFAGRIGTCLEIKDPAAAEGVISILRGWRVGSAHHPFHITSFDWDTAVQARRALELPTGYLTSAFDTETIGRCGAAGLTQICPPARLLDQRLVDAAHEAGLTARAWGVRDRADVDRLFATGADGATVNWPDWILDRGAT